MGREIRRVPPNWEHPLVTCEHWPRCSGNTCHHSMYDRDYQSAVDEWKTGFAAWENGERVAHREKYGDDLEFWEWEGDPPDRAYYRPTWTEEATWFQVYETVSEGTPVTPAFATKEELVDYLVTHGDFWDQRRGDGGWKRENAEQFVGVGFAFSLVVDNTPEGAVVKAPRDGAL